MKKEEELLREQMEKRKKADERAKKIIQASKIRLPKSPKLKEGEWWLPPYEIIINRETYKGKGRPKYSDYKKKSRRLYYRKRNELKDLKVKQDKNGNWRWTWKIPVSKVKCKGWWMSKGTAE